MNFVKKYSWLLPSLMFTCVLLLVRVAYTRSFFLLFIPWNMFLAGVPLLFSYMLLKVKDKFVSWGMFALWLLFFPNSMYIVTDLFHLGEGYTMPLWYDLLILFSAALNGIIMGLISLRNAERFLRRSFSPRLLPFFLFGLFLLCGYGIYLGRYLRWNSWDIFMQPHLLLWDIMQDILHPFRNNKSWMVSSLFAVWMHILYGYFKRSRRTLAADKG